MQFGRLGFHRAFYVLAWPLVVALAGCGPNLPRCFPVSGTVTVDGQPVAGGTITFYPEAGRSAMGKIEADGSYKLTTFRDDDGALPGRHAVTIKATTVSGPAAPESFEAELAQANSADKRSGPLSDLARSRKVLARDQSPLTADVAEQANQIDFALSTSD